MSGQLQELKNKGIVQLGNPKSGQFNSVYSHFYKIFTLDILR